MVSVALIAALILGRTPTPIIAEHGPTVPAALYVARLQSSGTPNNTNRPAAASGWQQMLPLHTPELSPGPLRFDRLETPIVGMTSDVCLIGTDTTSLRWVQEHLATLIARTTACLVVEIPDREAWERLRDATPGLDLQPAYGAIFAESLGLTRYPVVIHTDGRVSQ